MTGKVSLCIDSCSNCCAELDAFLSQFSLNEDQQTSSDEWVSRLEHQMPLRQLSSDLCPFPPESTATGRDVVSAAGEVRQLVRHGAGRAARVHPAAAAADGRARNG